MRYLRHLASAAASLVLLAAAALPASAQPATPAQPLVIGVDYADPANQQPFPPFNRLFEYTDFFSRAVTVHSGDTIDFRAAPGSFHVVALAADETVARAVYPVAYKETVDPTPATGSGGPKLAFGPSNFPITGGSTQGGGALAVNNAFGPPVCGVQLLGQQPCSFAGGNDIEVIGPTPGLEGVIFGPGKPIPVDQLVTIKAPPGSYKYFCYIHPGMRGDLTVVDSSQPTTTQAQIDAQAKAQFAADQAEALAAEKAANVVRFSGGAPGTRTYQVSVGAGTPDNHVAIDEMLPQRLSLAPGDQVQYTWVDPHNFHSVAFPARDKRLPEPFGFDCPSGYVGAPPPPAPQPPPCLLAGAKQPEAIGDPGNAPPGTVLSDPSVLVDAGVMSGTLYGVVSAPPRWSIATSGATKAGAYTYQCTIHDWMLGTLTFTAAASVAQAPAQVPARMPNTGGGGAAPVGAAAILLGLLLIGLGANRLTRVRR